MGSKGHKLVELLKFHGELFRGQTITQFPARGMVGLAKRADDKTPPCKLRIPGHAFMTMLVKVDGACIIGPFGHHGKDRNADIRQFGR